MFNSLTATRLRERLHYDPATGIFTWLIARADRIGKPAGCRNKRGYIQIMFDGGCWRAHRLAYLYMKGRRPPDEIDHRDRDVANNRWLNLRAATHAQNTYNRKRRSNNTTGTKGVTLSAQSGRYRAQLSAGGVMRINREFDTLEEAIAARRAAAEKWHGEFARHA